MRRSAMPFYSNGQASEGSANHRAWLEFAVSTTLDAEVSGAGVKNGQ